MSSSSEFQYFGGLIFFVLVLYTIVLGIFLCIRRNNIKKAIEYRNIVHGTNTPEQDYYDAANFSFEFRTDFDAVTQSALGKGCRWFLAVARAICFAFFFFTAVYLDAIHDNHGLMFFTNWNALLVTFYFGAASAASFLGIYAKAQRTEYGFSIGAGIRWSYAVRCLGVLVHSLFEVAGASSMFVMIFDFFFKREDTIDMVSIMNFVRALAVVVLFFELFLNNINVRFDQYPATIAWTMMYLMFVWPAVFTGIMDKWPYQLLQTRTSLCFGYYFLLFLFNFALYVLWWGVYKLKKTLYIKYNIGRYMDYGDEETELTPHEFMLLEATMNPLSMHGTAAASEMGGAHFYEDEDGRSIAYTIDGFPVDGYDDQYGAEGGLLYNPDVYGQAAYYAEDGTIIYPSSMGMDAAQPQSFDPRYGFASPTETDGTSYGTPYGYEQHSPFVHPGMGYADPRQGEFLNYPPWAAQGPQYAEHWEHGGAPVAPGGGAYSERLRQIAYDSGVAGESAVSPYGRFSDGASTEAPMEDSATPIGDYEADEYSLAGQSQAPSGHRVQIPKPYEGSALERGRGGRGRGRGAAAGGRGRGSAAQSAVPGGSHKSPSKPAEPINVTAEPLLDDQEEVGESFGPESGFDYNVVNSWGSYKDSGRVPHNPAEAGVSKTNKKGGIFSGWGWGATSRSTEDATSTSTTTGGGDGRRAAGKAGGGWFENITEGEHGEEEEYNEEHEFGRMEEQSTHNTGAFIASIAKNDAFHVPGTLKNARRPSGANPARLPPHSPQQPPPGGSIFRPPSLPRMFRTASQEKNSPTGPDATGRRPLTLQKLGSPQPNSNSGYNLRPPQEHNNSSKSNLFRPSSAARMAAGSGEKADPSASFRKASASQLPRTGSMEMGASQHGAGGGFDYSQMDAWASFRADGRVPHSAAEAGLESAPTIKVGGVGELDPHAEQYSGQKAGARAAPVGGWFDSGADEEGDLEDGYGGYDQGEHFVPESSAETHKSGTYIASAAKKEAFHAPSNQRRGSLQRPQSNAPVSGEKAGAITTHALQQSVQPLSISTMFRPPSLSKMLRSPSRERMERSRAEASPRRALNLQSLGNRPSASSPAAPGNPNASFRKASASQLPRTGSMEMGASQHGAGGGFDYSQMDAWASFRADGRVPHSAAEADLQSAPTIKVGGVGNLDPRAERPASLKSEASTTAAPASGAWFDTVASDEEEKEGEDGGDEYRDRGDHFVPESSADTHKSGAYIATAAKKEAFHAPESLSRPGRAPGRVKSNNQPAAAATGPEGSGSMFQPPSLTSIFRSHSGDRTPDGRRTLNLQSLGGAPESPASGMFRPPSVTRMFRSNSKESNSQGGSPNPHQAPAPRRGVNLQPLGGPGARGAQSPVPSFEGSPGLFRPPSVTRLFRPSSRENNTAGAEPPGKRGVNLRPLGGTGTAGGSTLRPLGQAAPNASVNPAPPRDTPAAGAAPTSQGSFFDNPNAPTGDDDGEEFGSGDSDDDFRLD